MDHESVKLVLVMAIFWSASWLSAHCCITICQVEYFTLKYAINMKEKNKSLEGIQTNSYFWKKI
ncbi:hypothetical protein CAEBREN_30124 [Caenorhabditis brenneri]|uniref:Uncharacterized protein n=1 Tax=Caenorhabditis brenneri TaxID=135651 RepID=G0P1L6_CAEBE|nr:hypothetical protein CAEBREN_30124 [Caenorhabditis brenneri]